MSSREIATFIGEVKRDMAEISESAMLRPDLQNPAIMAKTCGMYQGLARALDILDAVLSDSLEQEKSK